MDRKEKFGTAGKLGFTEQVCAIRDMKFGNDRSGSAYEGCLKDFACGSGFRSGLISCDFLRIQRGWIRTATCNTRF